MDVERVTYIINVYDRGSKNLETVTKSAQRTDNTFKTLGRTLTRFASFAAIGAVLKNSMQKIIDFEKAASNLSAITGATGDDLDYLKRKTLEYSKATGETATKTIEGFKLIASAKPELLSNVKALSETTKEALILSKASGLDLPRSATALTSSLNQFNLSADQSKRVINVLAAGSKFAAAEIPDLTASLEEFGGVANSMGLSIEESAAAVETLSLKNLKGSRAGIQLRNVLLKLGASADKNINPKVVGLSTALENLGGIQDNTTALTKMFGTENVLAAQTLIKNRKRVDELTKSLTGTNLAYEQAEIMTDNLSGDIDKLSSSWDAFVLGLNEGEGVLSKVFRNIIKFANEAIYVFTKLTTSFGQEVNAKAQDYFIKFKERIQGAQTVEDVRKQIEKEYQLRQAYFKKIEADIKRLGGISGIEKMATGMIPVSLSKQKYKDYAEAKAIWKRVEASRAYIKKLREIYGDETAIMKLLAEGKPPEKEPETPQGTYTGITTKGKTKLDKGTQKQISTITGAAPKTFNINIQNLVEQFNVNTENITEGSTEVKSAMIRALAEALADVQPIRD